MFFLAGLLCRRFATPFHQPVNHLPHQQLRRRRTGRNTDNVVLGKPCAPQIVRPVDPVTRLAIFFRTFAQAIRVPAVG